MARILNPRRREPFKPEDVNLPFAYIENAIVAEIGEEAYKRVVQIAAARIADHPQQGSPLLLPGEIIAVLALGWDRAFHELGEVDA